MFAVGLVFNHHTTIGTCSAIWRHDLRISQGEDVENDVPRHGMKLVFKFGGSSKLVCFFLSLLDIRGNTEDTYSIYQHIVTEGSLGVKPPTLWTNEEDGRRKKIREEKESEERRSMKHCVFPMFCGSGWLKSRLAKAAGAEPSGQTRDPKLHGGVARSSCGSQNEKNIAKALMEVDRRKFRSQTSDNMER